MRLDSARTHLWAEGDTSTLEYLQLDLIDRAIIGSDHIVTISDSPGPSSLGQVDMFFHG